jgi:Tfp pilus assembly protein PilP
VSGEFHGEGAVGLVNVGDMELVGVLKGGNVMLAMVEDSRGRGYVLRVGDAIMNGVVREIRGDSIVILQTFHGESQTVEISMKSKEGDEHAK